MALKQHDFYRACGTCISADELKDKNRVFCRHYIETMPRCASVCDKYCHKDDADLFWGVWDDIDLPKFMEWHDEFYKDLKHAF